MTEVWTELDGATLQVGTVHAHRRRGVESATFRYADTYLTDPRAYAIDPGLPLTAGSLQTPLDSATFGAFADTSPDRWGRNILLREERRRSQLEDRAPRSFGEFDLVLGVRDDLRQGNLRFRDGDDFLAPATSRVPLLTDVPALLNASEHIARDDESAEDLALLVGAGSSLGGARPKAHVLDDDGSLSIAKFPSPASDTWDVMAWEQVALDLAASAGCEVADHRLIMVEDRHVLVVKRFDREHGRRIGYVSALTMLETHDRQTGSYLEIAEVIERNSTTATDELQQLWRRMAFTVLISNTDDHLRNHGFLYRGNDLWRLSPAFDLNPDPTGRRDLSTAIDDSSTRASIRNLMGVTSYFRLSREEALGVLADVVSACSHWQVIAHRSGLQTRAIDQMAPAFEHEEAAEARSMTSAR